MITLFYSFILFSAILLMSPISYAVTLRMSPYAAPGAIGLEGEDLNGLSPYIMIAEFDPIGSPTGTPDATRFHATSAEVIVSGVRSFLDPAQLAETWVIIQDLRGGSLGMYFNFAIPVSAGSAFVLGSFNVCWTDGFSPSTSKPAIGTPGPEDLVLLSDSILTSAETRPIDTLSSFLDGDGKHFAAGALPPSWGLGEVTIVPEPSSFLFSLMGIGCLVRRGRSC